MADVQERLQKSLDIVRFMGSDAEVRITCAPDIVTPEVIQELGPLLRGVARVFLQPFVNSVPLLEPAFNSKPPLPKETMLHFAEMLKPFVGACVVRGQ
jgi:hypothetical protein